MADSIQRIAPTSIPLDRAEQFGKQQRRDSADGRRPRPESDKENRVAEDQPATPANDDAGAGQSKIKGKNLDLNA